MTATSAIILVTRRVRIQQKTPSKHAEWFSRTEIARVPAPMPPWPSGRRRGKGRRVAASRHTSAPHRTFLPRQLAHCCKGRKGSCRAGEVSQGGDRSRLAHTLLAGVCCRCYTQLPKQLTANALEQQHAPTPSRCSQPLPGFGYIYPVIWFVGLVIPCPPPQSTHARAPLLPAIQHNSLRRAGSPTDGNAFSIAG